VKLCRSYDELIQSIRFSTDVVVVTHTSNVTGEEAPLKAIYERAQKVGAKVIVDASQAMIYTVPEYFDYLVFSGHKIYGPTGIGVIFGPPLNSSKFGSAMSYYNGSRMQETDIAEAGTPNIAGIIGLGAAISFLDDSSIFDKCKKDFLSLFVYLKEEVEKLRIVHIGSNHILSLFVENPYTLEEHLRSEGIYVRVGRHCADFAMDNLNIINDPKWKGKLFDHRASVRISFACYNNMADVIRLIEALRNYLKGVD
jgi:cysteine desulfurase/selenocysteine lyase